MPFNVFSSEQENGMECPLIKDVHGPKLGAAVNKHTGGGGCFSERPGQAGEMNWAESHSIQQEQVWYLASLKGSHAAVQAADAALQKSVKYCNRVPTKVRESLSPEVPKTQLDMALCNLIYLDLFWAKDQTSYPLKVPSMLNFGSMPLCFLLYRAFCGHEDFEECSI